MNSTMWPSFKVFFTE